MPVKDALLITTKALPNAAANNACDSYDLGPVTGSNPMRNLGFFNIEIPALADHTNTSIVNRITLQSSAEAAANFANVDPLTEALIPGVASTGSSARTCTVAIPRGIGRYVRFLQTVPVNGGTGSNALVTYNLISQNP